MNTEQWFEKATAYFSGAMTAKEEQLFETETAASEELSQLMQLWKTTDAEAAVYEQNKGMAAELVATHQKLKAEFVGEQRAGEFSTVTNTPLVNAVRRKFSTWRWVAAAAAIAGIIFLVRILVPPSKDNTTVAHHVQQDSTDNVVKDSANKLADKNKDTGTPSTENPQRIIPPATLYAQAFAPDEAPENPNGPLDNAFFYYASAQYKNAIKAIDSAANKAPTRGSGAFTPLTKFYASYYKALSMMKLGNTAGAIPLLKKSILQSPSETLRAKARWYLALSYIKEEKISAAVETLQLLVNSPAGIYKSKAEKLLMALNKN